MKARRSRIRPRKRTDLWPIHTARRTMRPLRPGRPVFALEAPYGVSVWAWHHDADAIRRQLRRTGQDATIRRVPATPGMLVSALGHPDRVITADGSMRKTYA